METLTNGCQRSAILRALVAYPKATKVEIRAIVQGTFSKCSIPHIDAALKEYKIVKGKKGWQIADHVREMVARIGVSKDNIQTSKKVDIVWTPEAKTFGFLEAIERNKHRMKL